METEENTNEKNPPKKKGFFGRMFSKKSSEDDITSKDVVKEHDEVLRLKQELEEYNSANPRYDDFEEQVNAEEERIQVKPIFSNGDDKEDIIEIDRLPSFKEKRTVKKTVKKDVKKAAKKTVKKVYSSTKKPVKNSTNENYLNKNGMRAFEDELLNAKKELMGKKQELWLAKGVPVKTIKQLHRCIKEMNEKTFLMRQEGEEFSHWVKDHGFSEELAYNLRDVRNREEALEEIDKYFISNIPLPVREKTKAHHDSVVSHFDKLNEEHKKAMQTLEKSVKRKNPQLLNTDRIKRQFAITTDNIIDSLTQLVYALELIDEKTYEAIPLEEKEELKKWVEDLANKDKLLQDKDIVGIQERVVEEIRKYADMIEQRVEKEKAYYMKEDERLKKLQVQLQDEEKQLQAEWKNLQMQQKKSQSENDKQQRALFTQRTNIEKLKESVLKTIAEQEKLSESMREELDDQEEALQDQEDQVLKRQENILKEEKQLELRKNIAEETITKKEKEWECVKTKQEEDLEKKEIAWEKEKEKQRQAIEKERNDAQELINKKLELIEQEKNASEKLLTEKKTSQEKELAEKKEEQEKLLTEKKTSQEKELAEKKEEQEKLLTEKKTSQEKELARREAEIEEQMRELEKGREQYFEEQRKIEEELQKKAEAIGEGIEHIDKINKNVIDSKNELNKIREGVDEDVFKKYLSEQLKSISANHIPLEQAPIVQKVEAEQYDFYEAIDICNQCIEVKKFKDAKKMYNALKAEYEKGMLPQKEKEVLYDAIRELYANLHLAILNNE